MMAKTVEAKHYTPADFRSDQEPRWCPGCEDYAILKAFERALAELNIPREKHVVISGIGCSSRFPYYVNTYGFHTIHGRAIPIATGVKMANPELSVWVITGDGDGASIGGNHLIHGLRRNIDLSILLFDNRIYGLTKGQYSPTSEVGTVNKTAPYGTLEMPIEPASLAVAAGATFVARTSAQYGKHLVELIQEAHAHQGTSFIHIFQNCYVYNDGAFDHFTAKPVREDHNILVEHGKPLIFGKERNRGLRLKGTELEVVEFPAGNPPEDLAIFDETDLNLSFALARLRMPDFPVAMGVLRRVSQGSFEERLYAQIETAKEKYPPDLQRLVAGPGAWEVK